MQFFKHFTDSNSGKSLRQVRRKLGMAGIGQYWALVEICAKKLRKKESEEFTEAHCVFEFDVIVVADNLGTKPGYLGNILGTFQDYSLIKFNIVDFIVRIEMPKLLEYLDRDAKRPRKPRAKSALKIKNKDKDKEEDKEGRVSAFPENLDFQNILHATQFNEITLKKRSELSEIENMFFAAFAKEIPPIVKASHGRFGATVLHCYEIAGLSTGDFRKDLNSIINEDWANPEKNQNGWRQYVATRIANQAKAVLNAARAIS